MSGGTGWYSTVKLFPNFSNRFYPLIWVSFGLLQCFGGKESTCNAGDLDLIPGSGRSPGEGNGNPLQYSSLENPMDRGASWATVYGVSKSQMQQNDKHFWVPKYHIYMSPKFCHVIASSWCLKDELCPEVKLTLASWSDSGSVLKSHGEKKKSGLLATLELNIIQLIE